MKKKTRRMLVLIDGREFVTGNNCIQIRPSLTEQYPEFYHIEVDKNIEIIVPITSVLFERVEHGQIEVGDDNDEEFVGRTD